MQNVSPAIVFINSSVLLIKNMQHRLKILLDLKSSTGVFSMLFYRRLTFSLLLKHNWLFILLALNFFDEEIFELMEQMIS